jgi:hypothetical protein
MALQLLVRPSRPPKIMNEAINWKIAPMVGSNSVDATAIRKPIANDNMANMMPITIADAVPNMAAAKYVANSFTKIPPPALNSTIVMIISTITIIRASHLKKPRWYHLTLTT